MDGHPLALGRVGFVAVFLIGATASTRALAGDEQPSFREHAACIKHREAGEHALAAERCLAAYDALPDTPEALEARSLIAFDTRHSFRDAYTATGDVRHLCGEIRIMIRFIDYLDRRVRTGDRPIDRRDAQKLLDAARAELGERSCADRHAEEGFQASAPDGSSGSRGASEVEPAPGPAVDTPPLTRPARGLRVGGWTMLAIGLSFGLWSAGELVYGELSQRGRDSLLGAASGSTPPPDDLQREVEVLDDAGAAANRRAVVAGSLSGASMIAGITLLAVDVRRRGQRRRLALVPIAGPTVGARLRLDF
jgi:hypothetical protein